MKFLIEFDTGFEAIHAESLVEAEIIAEEQGNVISVEIFNEEKHSWLLIPSLS